MSSLSMAGAIFGVMLLLMALRVPIAISMFVPGANVTVVVDPPFASLVDE